MKTAVAAAKRWKPVYSVSVVNEPDTAGVSVCGYAKTYLDAYGKLRAAGVKRVLFGEFAPHNAQSWLRATLTRCGSDVEEAAHEGRKRRLARLRHRHRPRRPDATTMTRKLTHRTPKLYVTEAGFVLRHRSGHVLAASVKDGVTWWRNALKIASAHLTEIVAWDIRARPNSVWDSSLIDAAGNPRPAFALIANRR